jgi:hypothetical protein
MEQIRNRYIELCNKPSDINEHLPILYEYAKKCETIIETGVRGGVSSVALVYGLLCNNQLNKQILLNDINYCDISTILNYCKDLNIQIKYEWKDNLSLEINEQVDMVFIDTWHVYGQLKRELDKFSKITKKYIIIHDTTVDEIYGETIRDGHHLNEMIMQHIIYRSGFTREEICCGLGKAIDEFLINNTNWKLTHKFTNNNGLTILERIS